MLLELSFIQSAGFKGW